MRSVATLDAVQRALAAARFSSARTVSYERHGRIAELRIQQRRARVLALASKRLTASRSPLNVDEQAAPRPQWPHLRACPPGAQRTARDPIDTRAGEASQRSARTGRRDERERGMRDRRA